jgi:hypothetical protein
MNDETQAAPTEIGYSETTRLQVSAYAWSQANDEVETESIEPQHLSRVWSVLLVALVLAVASALAWFAVTLATPKTVELPAKPPSPTAVPPTVTTVVQPPAAPPQAPPQAAPAPPARSADDTTFLAMLNGYGVTDPDEMIASAHVTCNIMASGKISSSQLAEKVAAQNGISFDAANQAVTSAITVYCPKFLGR